MNSKAYIALLVLTIVAAVGGVLTLIPAATLYCFAIAGISCVIRASLIKRKAQFGKAVFRAPAVAVVSAILVLAVAASGWFISVKRQYPDGQSTPTITENH